MTKHHKQVFFKVNLEKHLQMSQRALLFYEKSHKSVGQRPITQFFKMEKGYEEFTKK